MTTVMNKLKIKNRKKKWKNIKKSNILNTTTLSSSYIELLSPSTSTPTVQADTIALWSHPRNLLILWTKCKFRLRWRVLKESLPSFTKKYVGPASSTSWKNWYVSQKQTLITNFNSLQSPWLVHNAESKIALEEEGKKMSNKL